MTHDIRLDLSIILSLLTVSECQTGKYLVIVLNALGPCVSWPWAKYLPIWPNLIWSTIILNHLWFVVRTMCSLCTSAPPLKKTFGKNAELHWLPGWVSMTTMWAATMRYHLMVVPKGGKGWNGLLTKAINSLASLHNPTDNLAMRRVITGHCSCLEFNLV